MVKAVVVYGMMVAVIVWRISVLFLLLLLCLSWVDANEGRSHGISLSALKNFRACRIRLLGSVDLFGRAKPVFFPPSVGECHAYCLMIDAWPFYRLLPHLKSGVEAACMNEHQS